jgi:ATP-dependent DNA ligase
VTRVTARRHDDAAAPLCAFDVIELDGQDLRRCNRAAHAYADLRPLAALRSCSSMPRKLGCEGIVVKSGSGPPIAPDTRHGEAEMDCGKR